MALGLILKNTPHFNLHVIPDIMKDTIGITDSKIVDPTTQHPVGPLDVFVEGDGIMRVEYVLKLSSQPARKDTPSLGAHLKRTIFLARESFGVSSL